MKKLIIGIVITVIALVLFLYLFIPARVKINESVTMKAPLDGVTRVLSGSTNRWWPGDTAFHFNENKFIITAYDLNAFNIRIIRDQDSLQSRMTLSFLGNDSLLVNWRAELKNLPGPFKRFSQYMNAKEIGKDMNTILASLKKFAENSENIYGIKIVKAIVKDSVLISTRRSFDHKPDVQEIDSMIRRLKNYIVQNGATEKNLPMLNVMKIDNSNYQVMTAIPVDRELPLTTEFAPKVMLKGGNILEAEIKGGPYTIERAFSELENYRSDYKYTSPAIPFQLLVTDRVKEKDTTKWITRLYYPIF